MSRINLKDVDVSFPIYGIEKLSLRHTLFERATGGAIEVAAKNDRVTVKALTNINLELFEGDRLGLIGHNGSGKSTLLKTLAGIYEPVRGQVLIEGRVTPLFDMMPGLDLEDSGYENIITSGILLGMPRSFVESKIPEIEEFSELGEYLSLPVRTYSAGMMTRLGFALVTAMNPDILVMDEGFGAADLRFSEKSSERMKGFIGQSRIMVIATHSDEMISSFCNKLAWLDQGKIKAFGDVDSVLHEYNESVRQHFNKRRKKSDLDAQFDENARPEDIAPAPQEIVIKKPVPEEIAVEEIFNPLNLRDYRIKERLARTNCEVRFTKLLLTDGAGIAKDVYHPGDSIVVQIAYEVFERVKDLAVLLRFYQTRNGKQFVVSDFLETVSDRVLETGRTGQIKFEIPDLPFRPGTFELYATLITVGNTKGLDVIDNALGVPDLVVEPRQRPATSLEGYITLDHQFDYSA